MIQDEDEKSKIILEAQSPACDITAFVEDDDETLYFYLYGPQGAIPQGMDPESFVPVQFCNNSTPSDLNPNELEVVFLEEGDSAALFYQNKIIAVIPSWGATVDGTLGYSAELSSEFMNTKPLAEMPKELLTRIHAA